jgi:integrase
MEESGLVFTTSVCTVVEPRNLSRTFEQLVQQSGVRRIRFHDLRHTCASLLLAQGVSPRVVMDVLGHSQVTSREVVCGPVVVERGVVM